MFGHDRDNEAPSLSSEMTPREIVAALDRYIIGQDDAKRAVAIALRNRVRRMHIAEDLRDEVIPKNILMIGPTGVGKTEIARRLAHLARAPFIKVEATKFTEVGYVGRDVDSIIRDLVEFAYRMVEKEHVRKVRPEAERLAHERLLEMLAGAGDSEMQAPWAFPGMPGQHQSSPEQVAAEQERERKQREQHEKVLEYTRRRLEAGELEDEEVEVELEDGPSMHNLQVFSPQGMEEMGFNMQEMLGNIFPTQTTARRMTVAQAREMLTEQEAQRLVDTQAIAAEAIDRAEQAGIVFIDELDKIAGRESGYGPEVSREGVQRDILPIIEGSTVQTKYGPVDTFHILFICAGAFHVSKPSDLVPELQGRLPIRVELDSLSGEDFRRILVEPENSLVRQYTELLATEGVTVTFTDEALDEVARIAQDVNDQTENIGARRLYTLMERLLEELSFEAPEVSGQSITIDPAYVRSQLSDLAGDEDLSRYML